MTAQLRTSAPRDRAHARRRGQCVDGRMLKRSCPSVLIYGVLASALAQLSLARAPVWMHPPCPRRAVTSQHPPRRGDPRPGPAAGAD